VKVARPVAAALLAWAVVAAPLSQSAAQPVSKPARIGILHPGGGPRSPSLRLIVDGLADLGRVEGRDYEMPHSLIQRADKVID